MELFLLYNLDQNHLSNPISLERKKIVLFIPTLSVDFKSSLREIVSQWLLPSSCFFLNYTQIELSFHK